MILKIMLRSIISLVAVAALTLAGCSSAQKARKEAREKISTSSGLYCDFVNGELFPADVEVALNIEIAKKCDANKALSITQYKTPAENNGVVFCCSISSVKPVVETAADKKEDVK